MLSTTSTSTLEDIVAWIGSGYFLGFTLVVSTMTYLRLGPLGHGPTELLMVLWMAASAYAISRKPLPAEAYRVIAIFSVFLLLAGAGWLSGAMLNIQLQGRIVRDVVAVSASAGLSVLLYLRLLDDRSLLRPTLSTIVLTAPIAYLSIYGETYLHLFHVAPWWDYRYMGWAHNPNQTAFLFVALPFLAGYLALTETVKWRQAIYTVASLACAFVGISTWSHGIRVGWAAAMAATFLFFGVHYFGTAPGRSRRRFDIYFGVPVLMLIAIFPKILVAIQSMSHAQNDKGYFRFLLWNNGLEALDHSPIFGLGTTTVSGTMGIFGGSEPHNAFIDFFVFAGPVAGFAFIAFTVWVYRRLFQSDQWILAGGFTALIVYTQFGGYFRHPLFWCLLQTFYWLTPQTSSRARAPSSASAAAAPPITASP